MHLSPEQREEIHLCQGIFAYIRDKEWASAQTLAEVMLGGTNSAQIHRIYQILVDYQRQGVVLRVRKTPQRANRRADHWIMDNPLGRTKAQLLAF
jgi:hypothetical protein